MTHPSITATDVDSPTAPPSVLSSPPRPRSRSVRRWDGWGPVGGVLAGPWRWAKSTAWRWAAPASCWRRKVGIDIVVVGEVVVAVVVGAVRVDCIGWLDQAAAQGTTYASAVVEAFAARKMLIARLLGSTSPVLVVAKRMGCTGLAGRWGSHTSWPSTAVAGSVVVEEVAAVGEHNIALLLRL